MTIRLCSVLHINSEVTSSAENRDVEKFNKNRETVKVCSTVNKADKINREKEDIV